MTEPVARIHKFNFDQPTMKNGRKTHVALVDKAANLTEALVLKARYETDTRVVEEYDEEDRYTYEKNERRVTDYGDEDYVYVRDTMVRIVEDVEPKTSVV